MMRRLFTRFVALLRQMTLYRNKLVGNDSSSMLAYFFTVALCLVLIEGQVISLGPVLSHGAACQDDEATCSDGFCIAKSSVCDAKMDCPDGSDENQCHESHRCQPNEFACAGNSSVRCVLKDWLCDGDNDCEDGSDEHNCDQAPPGSACSFVEFQCEKGGDYGAQCIPRSFHCDGQPDCQDLSDEVGCSAPIFVAAMPSTLHVNHGDVFVLNCRAVGIPTPSVVWRRNWGHVPDKCTQQSSDGDGELSCPDAQSSDQGAYSCEAMNIKGSRFAVPDTVVIVTGGPGICQRPDFNAGALTSADCQRCFCFGATNDCSSSGLFLHPMPLVAAGQIAVRALLRLYPELSVDRPGTHRSLLLQSPHAAEASVSADNFRGGQLYFQLPFTGPLLLSYGGYLRFHLKPAYNSLLTGNPDLIIHGNGRTVWYRSDTVLSSPVSLRLVEGTFFRHEPGGDEVMASREDIMMVLHKVQLFLVAAPLTGIGSYHGSISEIHLDTASDQQSREGAAVLVEQCRCPEGYTGLSCQSCAPGYVTVATGQWLGKCVPQTDQCPPSHFGDPSRAIECRPCPCFISDQKFGVQCRLGADDKPVCDCPPNQMGALCQFCSRGYSGDPQAGEACRPESACDPVGALDLDPDPLTGQCHCKALVAGRQCEKCKQRAFYLHEASRHGCINCHCMGVTDRCSASNWYRDQVESVFISGDEQFLLTRGVMGPAVTGVLVDAEKRQLTYSVQYHPASQPLYWSLPARYLGNKITAYGGELTATLSYPEPPRDHSSPSEYSEPDVEIHGDGLRIVHQSYSSASSSPQQADEGLVTRQLRVPLYEQHWRNEGGHTVERGELLAALAQLQHIFIRAAPSLYAGGQISVANVSLDIAVDHNTGQPRASAVEQCSCPPGYQGLSCERCVSGYRKVSSSARRHLCQPCSCNGFSDQCEPETGHCQNCGGNTAGADCGRCAAGYIGNPLRGKPCVPDLSLGCQCDPRGSDTGRCDSRQQCQCKTGVEGSSCAVCRAGYFSLSGRHSQGCLRCFCSDVSQQCVEAARRRTHIPMQLTGETHRFRLANRDRNRTIAGDRFSLNIAENEIGYNQFSQQSGPHAARDTLYWMMPEPFLGNQLLSYGAKLMVQQRFEQRQAAAPVSDYDVIIVGGDVILAWKSENDLLPDRMNSYEVPLSEEGDWLFLDPGRNLRRQASRRDLMAALTSVDALMIRAVMSTDMRATYLSNVVLETATATDNGQEAVHDIEECLCPRGYSGLSCEQCAAGHYRAGREPLAACRACPCNGNEEQCLLSGDQVICRCKIGYSGLNCQNDEESTLRVFVAEPVLIVRAGDTATLSCTGESRTEKQVTIRWSKEDGYLPARRALDDGRGTLTIRTVAHHDSGVYVCEVRDTFSVRTSQTVLKIAERVELARAPSLTVVPETLRVHEGDSATFVCEQRGSLAGHITWSSSAAPLRPDVITDAGRLTIRDVTKLHEGEYVCTFSSQQGSASTAAVLYVNARASSTSDPSPAVLPVFPEKPLVKLGDDLTIRCSSHDHSDYIVWSKINAQLPQSSYQSRGVLHFDRIEMEDGGDYMCSIISSSGHKREHVATVTVVPHQRQSTSPTAAIHPSVQTVPQGDSALLECLVTGHPTPLVAWGRSSGALSSRSSVQGRRLVIANAQPDDRDHYMCQAENGLGSARSFAVLDVEAREAPLAEVFPAGEVFLSRGGSVYLQCRATAGAPAARVTWSRVDGRALSDPFSNDRSDGVLRLNNLTSRDEGVYECTASNIVGEDRRRVAVRLQTQPSVYFNLASPHRVGRGDRVVIECFASGDPLPSVQWFREDQAPLAALTDSRQVGHREGVVKSRLVLEHALAMDSGLYVCSAANTAGVTERVLQLLVLNTHALLPQRSVPQPASQRYSVPRDGNAELRCHFKQPGHVQVRVHWSRDDGTPLPRDHLVRGGTLYLYDVTKKAEGLYTCSAVSDQHSNHVYATVDAYLSVVEPPSVSLHPAHQVVRPGQDVFILCSASGTPPIALQWSRKSERGTTSAVSAQQGQLNFRDISVKDAGLYVCTATNEVAKTEGIAEVVVHDGPSIEAVRPNVSAHLGSSVLMQCRVRGAAEAVHWTRENNLLPASAHVNGDSLRIGSVIASDSGRYWCTVRDAYGVTARDSVLLTIQSPDDTRITITSSTETIRLGMTVDIMCHVTSGRSLRVRWRRDQLPLSDNTEVRGATMRVHQVRRDNGGVYECVAEDEHGPVLGKQYLLALADEEAEKEQVSQFEPAVRRVRRGAPVLLDCSRLQHGGTTFHWKRHGHTVLPNQQSELQIAKAKVEDAGIYECSVEGGVSRRLLWFLLVEDVVPAFDGAEGSYIELVAPAPDTRHFHLEISFRPRKVDGLLLYIGGETGDFFSFGLQSGRPVVEFGTSGGNVSLLRSGSAVDADEWHTVALNHYGSLGQVDLDGEEVAKTDNLLDVSSLDLDSSLFLAGVPKFQPIHPNSEFSSGFSGCVSRLDVAGVEYDFSEVGRSGGPRECPVCQQLPASSQCVNGAVCQAESNRVGHRCVCREGFSGDRCQHTVTSSCNEWCGGEECVREAGTVRCLCGLGLVGERCDARSNITVPLFNRHSGMSFGTPRTVNRLEFEISLRPDNVDVGLVLYMAESPQGLGDFVALVFRQGFIELNFNVDQQLARLTSESTLEPDHWYLVRGVRDVHHASLQINHGGVVETNTFSQQHSLLLQTPLLLGAPAPGNVTLPRLLGPTEAGFSGCIGSLVVGGTPVDIIASHVSSHNIGQCLAAGEACQSSPCANGAICRQGPSLPDYQCVCAAGFRGADCTEGVHPCDLHNPCQNGGVCREADARTPCHCPIGFSGDECQTEVNLNSGLFFGGKSFLELPMSLLLSRDLAHKGLQMTVSAREDGLLMILSSSSDTNGALESNHFALAVRGGRVEMSVSVPGHVARTVVPLSVASHDRHVINWRTNGSQVTLRVRGEGGEPPVQAEVSAAFSPLLLLPHHRLFLGGLSDVHLYSGVQFLPGLFGCVQQLSVGGEAVNMTSAALSGLNIAACSRALVGATGGRGPGAAYLSQPDLNETQVSVSSTRSADEAASPVPLPGNATLPPTDDQVGSRFRVFSNASNKKSDTVAAQHDSNLKMFYRHVGLIDREDMAEIGEDSPISAGQRERAVVPPVGAPSDDLPVRPSVVKEDSELYKHYADPDYSTGQEEEEDSFEVPPHYFSYDYDNNYDSDESYYTHDDDID